MNAYLKQWRAIFWSFLGITLVAGILISVNILTAAYKTTSPGKLYHASYNRLTQTVTVKDLNSGTKWHFDDCQKPAFLWSPGGNALCITADTNGTRRIEIFNPANNASTWIPFPEQGGGVEAVEWRDDDHVLYTNADSGERFVFEVSSHTVHPE